MGLIRFQGGAGQGGFDIYVKATNDQPAVFTSTSLRDSYFSTNPNELAIINGESFVVGVGPTNEDPASVPEGGWFRYEGGQWIQVLGSLVGATGAPGQDGMGALDQDIPAGTILQAVDDNGNIVPGISSLMDTGEEVQSNRRIMAPDGGGVRLGGTTFYNAANGVAAQTADGDIFYPVASRFDPATGTSQPFYLDVDAPQDLPVQTVSTETITSGNIQFSFASTNTGIAVQYRLISDKPTETTDVNITFELNNHGSGDVIFDWRRATGGTGATFPAGDGTTEFTLDLPLPAGLVFEEDDRIFITIAPPAGETVSVRGGDFADDLGTQNNFPFVTARGLTGSTVPIITQNQLGTDAGDVVQLDSQGRLPAVDGSQLTNIDSASDNYVDEVEFTRAGNDLTLTLGRTGSLADLSDTVTLPAMEGGNLDPINTFQTSQIVNASNIETFASHTNIYTRTTNQCGDAVTIQTAGLTQTANGDPITYPYEIVIRHAGPERSTVSCSSSDGPSEIDGRLIDRNELIVHFRNQDGSRQLFRLASSQNVNRTFYAMNVGDSVSVLFETANSAPILERLATEDPRLNQRFDLSDVTIAAVEALGSLQYSQTGYIAQKGEEFEVTRTGTIDGFEVRRGDVLKALVAGPNLFTVSETEWAVIRNISSFSLPSNQKSLLNQVAEHDTTSTGPVSGDVEIWLLDAIPSAAPLLADAVTRNGIYTAPSDLQNKVMLVAVPSNIDTADLLFIEDFPNQDDGISYPFNDVFTDFESVIPDNSNGNYFLLGSAVDSARVYSLRGGHTTAIRERNVAATFTFDESVRIRPENLEPVPVSALTPQLQALVNADHELSPTEMAQLAGILTTAGTAPFDGQLVIPRHFGPLSNDRSDYQDIRQLNGVVADFEPRTVTFLVPRGSTGVALNNSNGTPSGLTVTSVATVFGFDAYQVNLPATAPGGSPFGTQYFIVGNQPNITATGLADAVKVRRANLAEALVTWIESLSPDTPSPTTLPEVLQQLSRHLTATTDTTSGWTAVEPQPIRADLARQFAALWDENRRTFTGNYFADIADVEVIGFQGNNIFYYPSPNDAQNRIFQGAQSYILNSNVRIRNTAGGSQPISEDFTKIISFNYAIDFARIADDANLNMLRVGPTASTAAIGISGEEGLFLNIGRQDGGQRTRTYDSQLSVDGGHWHDRVDETTTAEAEVIIPQSLSGSLSVTIDIQLDDDGNDEGTHSETVTITNVGADQNLGSRTFNYTIPSVGPVSITVDLIYDAVNNDLSQARRVLFLRPTQPFTNAALTYNVSAVRHITETWNVPTSYARDPINAGTGHDDFGLFDPHLWETEQLDHRNRVILAFSKYRQGDTDTDPEMAVTVIVDGQVENNGNPIRLHRPASDFTFDDMSFGNNNVGIAHIQVYDYDGPAPSGQELLRLYNNQANWLGAFWPPGHAIDRMTLDANLELSSGHGIILTDTSTSTRKLLEIDSGSVLIKDA